MIVVLGCWAANNIDVGMDTEQLAIFSLQNGNVADGSRFLIEHDSLGGDVSAVVPYYE
jgi:hypothetical protein